MRQLPAILLALLLSGAGAVAYWHSVAQDAIVAAGVDCTGGTITHSGGNTLHTFASGGSLVCTTTHSASVLVVAGGGSGGSGDGIAGGGGAGGVCQQTGRSLTATTYTVTVGAGGTSVSNGADSVFDTITSNGGGSGGIDGGTAQAPTVGGSGGGGAYPTDTGAASNQTNSGGATCAGFAGGVGVTFIGGGGGGGAGSVGADAVSATGGAGGSGFTAFDGNVYGCGGGGGGTAPGAAGCASAGTGGTSTGPGNDATGSGSGGGGAANGLAIGGAGGSGVVLVQYPSSSPSYTGPGDVVGSALMFWGGQAYTGAYASGGGLAFNACDAGDAHCGDLVFGSDGNVVDSTISGASNKCSVITCTIKKIYDHTLGNNCTSATCDLVQATEANRAKIVFVAGRAYIDTTTCFGTCDYFTATTFTHAAPFTAVTVAKFDSSTQRVLLHCVTPQFAAYGFSGANTVYTYDGTAVNNATASDNAFHVISSTFVTGAGSSNITVDGSATTATNGGVGCANQLEFLAYGGALDFSGQVGNFGIWGTGFSGGNQSSMNTQLHTNWGF